MLWRLEIFSTLIPVRWIASVFSVAISNLLRNHFFITSIVEAIMDFSWPGGPHHRRDSRERGPSTDPCDTPAKILVSIASCGVWTDTDLFFRYPPTALTSIPEAPLVSSS